MNVLDLPTEAGHHQCGRGENGSGRGSKGGAKKVTGNTAGAKAKQYDNNLTGSKAWERKVAARANEDGIRSGIWAGTPSRAANITRAKTSRVKTG